MARRLGEAIYIWLESKKKDAVKAATYDRLITSYNLLLKHPISEVQTDILTDDDLQNYVKDLTKQGYALTTIKKQFHLLTGYITYANVRGDILRPIYKEVSLPTRTNVRKQQKDVIAYNHDEQRALTDILSTMAKPAYTAALLMLETGCRIGEVLALEWHDIDWRRRSIRINKTFVRLGNGCEQYIQNEPKSYASIREVPLSTKATDILKQWRAIGGEGRWVIHDDKGKWLTYEAVRWQITNACRQAGVPYYGQHVFRHTFASNCYERGCDVKILSKLLGHADVTVTYNTYIHLFGDELEEMRKVIG